MEILSSFGIHWTSLVAQIINFGLLVFILTKLVYKPLLNALADREKVIKKLAEDSSSAEKMAQDANVKQKEVLDEARDSAKKIIKETEIQVEKLRITLTEEAKKEADKIIKDGERRVKEEQNKFNASLRAELVSLVAVGIEKTVGKYIDKSVNEKLSAEALEMSLKASHEKNK